MPSIPKNLQVWDETYAWSNDGDEWSSYWGDPETQWYGTIFPRIKSYLPVDTALEIAPGRGRWTQFLKDHCNHLYLVDLSPSCISHCKLRFSRCSNISYFVNDGKSLEMIPDHSIDFAFSFDSLVHAEDIVMDAYVAALSSKLSFSGVAFLHHSNIGEYSLYLEMLKKLGRFRSIFRKIGILDDISTHWRAETMTASKFLSYCENHALNCISQEKINWANTKRMIDCLSLIIKNDSIETRGTIYNNKNFMQEAKYLSKLSSLYLKQWK